jgi:N-acetylneuraminate synthase
MSADVYVIAEAGVNHNGSPAAAEELVLAAARSGADAVKFQTFKAHLLATRDAPKAAYQKRTTPAEETQAQMLAGLELDDAAHAGLAKLARSLGIDFLSSAFDVASLDMLVRECALPRIKMPSGEITNPVLLLDAARRGLPVILSTGMATLDEIRFALGVLAFGATRPKERPSTAAFAAAFASGEGKAALRNVTLLHCVSAYPAPVAETNLRAMDHLRDEFGLPVGFSDHSEGIGLPIAAVARGAVMIEKHLTLDRTLPGPDQAASLEPAEFAEMVRWIRATGAALGDGRKVPQAAERDTARVARRSLVAVAPIRRGEAFTPANLGAARPASGVPAAQYWDWIGRPASRDFAPGELVS